MEWFEILLDNIQEYISVPYLLTFLFSAYVAKTYLGKFLQRITKFNWKTVYTVFILATLLAVPFILFTDEGWVQVSIAYCVGTSGHELFFHIIETKLTKPKKN